jgi:hypothetical protein
VETQQKCQLAVCECRTSAENPYCSEYCQQAASQAIQRDFCQCSHAGCEQLSHPIHTGRLPGLPASISCIPGQLMIEYASVEDLRRQLQLLTQALDQQPEALPLPAEAIPRRSPTAEQGRPRQKAQFA